KAPSRNRTRQKPTPATPTRTGRTRGQRCSALTASPPPEQITGSRNPDALSLSTARQPSRASALLVQPQLAPAHATASTLAAAVWPVVRCRAAARRGGRRR